MTERPADPGHQSEDKQHVQDRDPGGADGVEAAGRVDGEGRVQDLRAGAIAFRDTGGAGNGYRDTLERRGSRSMAGVAIADRRAAGGKLVRLVPRAHVQSAL